MRRKHGDLLLIIRLEAIAGHDVPVFSYRFGLLRCMVAQFSRRLLAVLSLFGLHARKDRALKGHLRPAEESEWHRVAIIAGALLLTAMVTPT